MNGLTRPLLVGAAAAGVVALATGIPTDVIPNPWFMRMTPAPWWTVPVWVITAVLSGVWVAVSMRDGRVCFARPEGTAGGAGAIAGWLAVGCPVCNKIVVAILGVSGALTWFAPLQPLLAVAAPLLLLMAISVRLRSDRGRRRFWMADVPGASDAAPLD